jgi:DNA-directed RNA polymerase subunit alpha
MVGIPIPQEIYTIPLDDLDLSLRVYNRLKRRSIHVVGQVLTMDDEDLLSIRHFAEKSLQEVYDRLKERGLLPVSEEEFKRLKGSELSPQSDHHSVTDEEMA